jgi:uncharacterized membrane protein YedE/YeeE|tara:strand:- start:3 stop:407 length:405 start_codon:yes stop_codon:yes gene_type:complete
MNKLVALFCGTIFGIGLVISQMINPAKVLGFLNVFGEWDPSLALVMVGALIISSPLFHLFKNKEKPIFSTSFSISENKEIDKRLIFGSILFGAGWGLAGLCPGPAISSIALLNISSVTFVFSMFIGFYIASKIN